MAMNDIISSIKNCNENCYKDRYKFNLKASGRVITKEELQTAPPLIDEWQNQSILFISQAPSKQAFADNALVSLENNFFSQILIPKLFPGAGKFESYKMFREKVFWIHTANCYPFVYEKGPNKNRDRFPDLRCVNKIMGEFIDRMQPMSIILMSHAATKYFASDIRKQIKSKSAYPSLTDIIEWQFRNKKKLEVRTKTNCKNTYKAIAIPHAADWNALSQKAKYAYNIAFEMINGY